MGKRTRPVVLISTEFTMYFDGTASAAKALGCDKRELDNALKRKDGYVTTINGVGIYIDEAIEV